MKINLTVLFFICLLATGFLACKKAEEAGPAPEPAPDALAHFTQNKNIAEQNDLIAFFNKSENAVRFEWDFGNGKFSTAENPRTTYPNLGTYTIKLTAYNADNVPVIKISSVEIVNKRFFSLISVENIKYYKDTSPWFVGSIPWDSQDGPDLKIGYKPKKNAGYTYTFVHHNITQYDKYMGWYLNANIPFTDENWVFTLYDEDSPDPDEVMDTFELNPMGDFQTDQNGFGRMRMVGNNGFTLEIYFHIG